MNHKSLGIYIHIPFCVQKCLYCDFISGPSTETEQKDYVNQILKEIQTKTEALRSHTVSKDNDESQILKKINNNYIVDTIFIGGGTPSVLKAEEMVRILCKLKEAFSVSPDCECTIEVNPGTVDYDKLIQYKEAGVNRLSIGLQSCNDTELKALGRIHDYKAFEETYHLARKAGFYNINVDLMSSIPMQTLESFSGSLKKVAELEPEHISVYSLIVEEGTPFYHMDLILPSEEEERQIYTATGHILKEYGYTQYEISNYAKPGKECMHNVRYWKCKEYIGFGVAAASFMDSFRWKNTIKKDCYLNADMKDIPMLPQLIKNTWQEDTKKELIQEVMREDSFYEEAEYLSKCDRYAEFMFMGLRMNAGVSDTEFAERFGTSMNDIYGEIIAKHVEKGLLIYDGKRVQLTDRGRDVSNYVMSDFLFLD